MKNKIIDKSWLIDFEFGQDSFGRPDIVCLVAKEVESGKVIRLFRDQLDQMKEAPFGPNDCSIAYYAPAEMSCYLKLGWNLPKYVIDLYVEFRNLTNGKTDIKSRSLLGAMDYFDIPAISISKKEFYRELAIRGGPFSNEERQGLLDYCQTDVEAAEKLLLKMSGKYSVNEALLRGEFMKCIAIIENNGIPVNAEYLKLIDKQWPEIRNQLIDEVNLKVSVFKDYKFSNKLFRKYLSENGYSWPYTEGNKIDLQDETFKDMIRFCPSLENLAEVRYLSNQLKLAKIPVYADSRTRCSLSPFGSKTGRNQPSTSKFIFGPSAWIRNLIQASPGISIAYIDWSQQEFGIAAALSNDENMKCAYRSGDPYLEFAKYTNAVPSNATKASHPEIREVYKACVLAVQYGMSADSLAVRIQSNRSEAEDLLSKHKRIFSTFWEWTEKIVNHAATSGKLTTCFGWNLFVGEHTKNKTVTNFLMQATGAEMLRLACIWLVEADIKVCATIHDAILIESATETIEDKTLQAQKIMKRASEAVLNGFSLESEAKSFDGPSSYYEKRGEEMWLKLLDKVIKHDQKESNHAQN